MLYTSERQTHLSLLKKMKGLSRYQLPNTAQLLVFKANVILVMQLLFSNKRKRDCLTKQVVFALIRIPYTLTLSTVTYYLGQFT